MKVLSWVIVAVLVVLVLALLMVLPARRVANVPPSPEAVELLTPTPLPSPTPVTLTPEQEELTDLEAEGAVATAEEDFAADAQSIDAELRGL